MGNSPRDLVRDYNQAFLLYDFVTNTSAGAVPSGELLTVEDGLIRSITLRWDMRRWPEVPAELARPAVEPAVTSGAGGA